MKFSHIVIGAIAVLGTVQYLYQHKKVSASSLPPVLADKLPAKTAPLPAFRCEGKAYCSQMTSRAEAEFYLANCPGTKMDGDHDGIPCERDGRW